MGVLQFYRWGPEDPHPNFHKSLVLVVVPPPKVLENYSSLAFSLTLAMLSVEHTKNRLLPQLLSMEKYKQAETS